MIKIDLQVDDVERATLDVTTRASSMPRDSALLYKNKRPRNTGSPAYLGLLKIADGTIYWAGIWVRSVKGEQVLELRLSPKKERRNNL